MEGPKLTPGEAIRQRAIQRDQQIKAAMKDRHLYLVEHLPDRMAARLLEWLGYRIVTERPQVESLGDGQFAIEERWFLERNGEFITGDKELWERRYDE